MDAMTTDQIQGMSATELAAMTPEQVDALDKSARDLRAKIQTKWVRGLSARELRELPRLVVQGRDEGRDERGSLVWIGEYVAAGLAEPAREARRALIRKDTTTVTMERLRLAFGYADRSALAKCRGAYLATARTDRHGFIPAANEDDPNVATPRDTPEERSRKKGTPLHEVGAALHWGNQSNRLDDDFYGLVGGMPKPGRTPKDDWGDAAAA